MKPTRTFLLRCWYEGMSEQDEQPIYRFLISEIGGQQRQQGLADLEALVEFIERKVANEPSVSHEGV